MKLIGTWALLLGFWVLLSGKFDLWHLGWGIGASLVVSALGKGLLFKERLPLVKRVRETSCFLLYLLWLLKEIFKANLHVAYLVWNPRMKDLIDPRVIRFKTQLEGDLAKVTFANSITLTPGTITLLLEDDLYYVHAIDLPSALGLPGEMEERIKKVFETGT